MRDPELDHDVLEYHIEHDVAPIRIAVEEEIKRLEAFQKSVESAQDADALTSIIENLDKAISK